MPGFHASPDEPFVPYWGDLVRRLVALGSHVTVFALRRPAHAFSFWGAAVVPLGLGTAPLAASPPLWVRAARVIAREVAARRLEVLYAVHANEPGVVGVLARSLKRVPFVAQIGGGELASLPDIGYGSQGIPIERMQVALTLSSAQLILAPSRQAADATLAHRAVARRRVAVLRVPLPVDCTRFQRGSGGGGGSLLHVADLNPVKDQTTLLAAFGKLAARDPRVTLDIVGGGHCLASLRRQAQDLSLTGRLRWWGRIPHDAMHHVYGRCDAFALSSRHEAQSVALAEAAASGLPIATTAVGIARELPEDGTFLVPQRNPDALAHAMALALGSAPSVRTRQAEAARRTFDVPEADRRLIVALRRARES